MNAMHNMLSDVGKRCKNVVHKHAIQELGQITDPTTARDTPEHRVVLEELLLLLGMLLQLCPCLHILEAATRDAHKTEMQRVHPPLQHGEGVSGIVHEVKLCDNANGPVSLRVHFSRNCQCIRCREVRITSYDSQDQTSRVLDMRQHQLPDVPFYVGRLITDGHSSDPRQVNESEVDDPGRRDTENDRLVRYHLSGATDALRFTHNFFPNFVEIVELLPRSVLELTPLSV
mmetsp:Transcript_39846/g.105648  ORF Transcript_39846/g.105648 Transcript_39846/m.105648 type:complete len:230 (+) Transcript_39846:1361-2050(+)